MVLKWSWNNELTSGSSVYSTPCWAVAFGSMAHIFNFPFLNRPSVGTNFRLKGVPNTFSFKLVLFGSKYGEFLSLVVFDVFGLSVSSMVFSRSSRALLLDMWWIGTTSYSGTGMRKKLGYFCYIDMEWISIN